MKNAVTLLALLVLSISGFAETVVEHPEWKTIFDQHGLAGTTVVYDLKADRFDVYDVERAKRSLTPASTFKIANSLISLETGVVRDEWQVLRWDGVKRDIEAWNRDHTLRTGIKYSVVPAFQQIAREIGQERMQSWIQKLGYGNQDISGGIDHFWLGSSLKISAWEQIGFLKRLYRLELPVSERSMRIVKDALITEATASYLIRAKTGWQPGEPSIGWWVGWVEKDDNTYFFATNMDIADASPTRMTVTKEILKTLGVLP